MLTRPRARRPLVLGPSRLWALALGVGVLALGCTRGSPPAAPVGSAEPSAPEPVSSPDATPAEPLGVESGAPEAAGADRATQTAATAPAARDARSKDEIQRVMADHRALVRACYDQALAQNPGISGDLVVDFTIDPHGKVKQAEVNWSESDLHIPELDTCAVDAIRSLEFPASSRGMESKVSYPFNFNPRRAEPPPATPEPPVPSKR